MIPQTTADPTPTPISTPADDCDFFRPFFDPPLERRRAPPGTSISAPHDLQSTVAPARSSGKRYFLPHSGQSVWTGMKVPSRPGEGACLIVRCGIRIPERGSDDGRKSSTMPCDERRSHPDVIASRPQEVVQCKFLAASLALHLVPRLCLAPLAADERRCRAVPADRPRQSPGTRSGRFLKR